MKKIKKVQDGIWKTDSDTLTYQVDARPDGREGTRYKKAFQTLGEARRFLNHKIALFNNKKDWEPDPDDNRKLSELIDLWYRLHGKSLRDNKKRFNRVKALAVAMDDPIARKITPTDWANYRSKRLEAVTARTINNEHTFLNAVFNELIRLDEINYNPIKSVRKLKCQESIMGFLENDEIPLLFEELKKSKNESVYYVAKIALSTGARWSEAEGLKGSQISNNKITYTNTKGGKNRTIPISKELASEIPLKRGNLFTGCEKAFKEAVKRAGIELPKGQMTHVLRHTFASHFMMNGGNILVLQQILGHANIVDTMKYAHFSKTHLEDAIKLNPLAKVPH